MHVSSSRSMLSNIATRIKLLFRKDKELYFALYNILGTFPRNITYYKIALMHKSLGHRATAEEMKALNNVMLSDSDRNDGRKGGRKGGSRSKAEGRKGGKHGGLGKQLNNERLEFLGDAILDAVVGDLVYRRYPGKPEGFLTNTRSNLVKRETLGKLAQEMGISRLIMASGRSAMHNSYMGGNAFEALVGALYLDRGYDACQAFWNNHVMGKHLNADKIAFKEVNFKSKILEWSQKNRITIEYRLEEQSQDKNGSPIFVYTCMLEGVEGCSGEGYSKKEAQQKASEAPLKKLRSDSKFHDSIFSAKTVKTQMEEVPAVAVPVVEEMSSPIVTETAEGEKPQKIDDMNFSLDDVSAKQPSREEIIAAAEEAAYRV